jgi:hypothetical protein
MWSSLAVNHHRPGIVLITLARATFLRRFEDGPFVEFVEYVRPTDEAARPRLAREVCRENIFQVVRIYT